MGEVASDLDVIAACMTAPGCSARAAIRLSGERVCEVVAEAVSGMPRARGVGGGALLLSVTRWLPVLLARYVGPKSYTGEDVLEILLPGSPVLIERALARLVQIAGVRLAQPGEFTLRALRHGRLTLAQAEGVAGVIGAESSEALAAARVMLDGAVGRQAGAWAAEAADLLSLVEAGIDFSDQEDVRAISQTELRARLTALGEGLRAGLTPSATARPREGTPLVALAGAPNAGKSTLVNALLGRTRAVASPEAGTTRDVLMETLTLPGGQVVQLADAPGVDGTRESNEVDDLGRAAAVAAWQAADVVVWCDPGGKFESLPAVGPRARVVRVRTFADRPGPHAEGVIEVCGLDGWNLAELRRAIASAAWGAASGYSAAPRHRAALDAAVAAIDQAAASTGLGDEVVAANLREALAALGEVTGETTTDEVLARIFANFCVGK